MVAVANTNATFADLLARADITQAQLAAHLDALDTDERVRQCRMLGKKQLRRLFAVCADAPAFTLEDLIPSSATAEVRWAGKNSLGLFTHFEKRFYRQNGKVVGYNFNPGIAWFTGPGYFVTLQAPTRPKEIVIDYTQIPSTAPPGWPAVKSNDGGPGKLIYGGMNDFCRRVCQTVIIGSAERKGKEIGAYFVLARM